MIETEDYITPKQGTLINKKGEFDLEKVYKKAASWFPTRLYDFTEKEHTHKDKPQGFEILIKFEGERKVDDYVKFHIHTTFLSIGYREKKGYLKINIKAYLELDYRKRWEINFFTKFLRFIYNNYIIKHRIKTVYEGKLYSEMVEYTSIIKKELGLLH